MRIIGFLFVGLVALYFYLVNYGESVVAEQNCDGGFFIQVNEYSSLGVVLFSSESEGNVKITYSNGTKEYLPDVKFIGEGNQKIALISDDRWSRYVFGNSRIFEGATAIQCY